MKLAASTPPETTEIKALSGLRRAIAERMMASLASSAQLSFHRDVDITDLLDRRRRWKAVGQPLSLEDIAIRSLAATLADHPGLNGVVDGDRLLLERHVQLCVAISANGALMTPVIRDADLKSVAEIAAIRADFVARAGRGRLQVSEMKGGTITISNLGLTNVQYFTPILNNGQTLLLGLGRIDTRLSLAPNGDVQERSFLSLSLTADHRVVDGLAACEVLDEFCGTLADFDPTAHNRTPAATGVSSAFS